MLTLCVDRPNIFLDLALYLSVYLLQIGLICRLLGADVQLSSVLEDAFVEVTNFVPSAEVIESLGT